MTADPTDQDYADRIGAITDLLGRTGANGFEVRYSEPEIEGTPTVWLAIASYADGKWEAGAGAHPVLAGQRLCQHCHRPSMGAARSNPPEDAGHVRLPVRPGAEDIPAQLRGRRAFGESRLTLADRTVMHYVVA